MVFRVMSCKRCGQDEFAIGPVSRKGWCEECSAIVAVEHAVQMHARSGPAWRHWLDRMGEFVERERQGEGS